MSLRTELKLRGRAAGLHLLISAGIAVLAAGLVFGLWYPGVYRLLAGGQNLFLILTSVDVVLGPLLTFSVFNLSKGWPHLRRDLAIIGVVQLAALVYGLHTVYAVRPVAMVLEGNRFRVVPANDVAMDELPQALPEFQRLPVTGPWLLGTRTARSVSENNDAIFLAIKGADVGQRPTFWQPYSESAAMALTKSRPVGDLLSHYPNKVTHLEAKLKDMKIEAVAARFLPVISRDNDWCVVINTAGVPVGFLPANGFF